MITPKQISAYYRDPDKERVLPGYYRQRLVPCAMCGTEFWRAVTKRVAASGPFCSKQCQGEYQRKFKPKQDVLVRAMGHVTLSPTGCLLWTGSIHRTGYATIRVNNKSQLAHRVLYERILGPIPDGMVLDHICRVRHCVNPHHMDPATQRENILRGDGIAARRARQTHCIRGHELAGANLKLRNGRRVCRQCE